MALAEQSPVRRAVTHRRGTRSQSFRPDIEGMRAIAILLIVAYHAGIPGFSGGFIGVDVFFVLSGYLITRHLLDEAGDTGRLRFGGFYGRRIRRLVPGLGLMVAVTLVASMFIVAPFDMREIAKEGAASALYFSNLLFAQNAQNYFGPLVTKSPFLHTWSLGVEEQFYLVWPILVFGCLFVARRRPQLLRRYAIAVLVAVVILSFTINLRWTGDGSSWAFYSLPTRAWEFAVGGVLAVAAEKRMARPLLDALVGFIGLALLAVATTTFSDATPYPGRNALIPVVATGLLVFAGQNVAPSELSPVGQVLSARPMLWIGGLSYSWYLWHWPFIVLTVAALNNDGTPIRTAAALVSLGVAYLASRYVENPIRFNEKLVKSVRRTFAMGLRVTLAVLIVAGGAWAWALEQTPSSFARQMKAASAIYFPLCRGTIDSGGTRFCIGGDATGSTSVALVGDSHAAMWFNAMSVVAREQGVRLVLASATACPFIPVELRTGKCPTTRAQGMAMLAQIKPDAVVLSEHEYLGRIVDAHGNTVSTGEQASLWKHAFASFLSQMDALGIRPAIILDNPTLPETPNECVSRTGSVTACAVKRSVALAADAPLQRVELEVLAARPGVPRFAPDAILCNSSVCPLELDGHLLYLDTNHLLLPATRMMEPELSTLLRSVLGF